MNYCPKCTTIYPNTHNYCLKDGTELKPEPKCKCGYGLSYIEKFCPKCGLTNTSKYESTK